MDAVETVCTQSWFNCYIESLSEEDQSQLQEKESSTRFKFGDGSLVHLLKKVIIPASVGSCKIMIETDVVPNEVPLLLSKELMKKARTSIDFAIDKVTMLAQTVDRKFTHTGHYAVPISTTEEDLIISEVEVLFNETSKATEDKKKVARKLPRQFAHLKSKKIIKLIKNSGKEDEELFKCITNIENKCEVCKRCRKPNLRPAVEFSLAKEFQNETVPMDLKPTMAQKFYTS